MIPRVHDEGRRTYGLLVYLYGPGKAEEHVDPHLVAAFDSLAPDPGRDPDATLKDLQLLLDQPVAALPAHRRPEKHVWHCSIRAAPGDRVLTDEEWGHIARRVLAATGIDPGGRASGCRWAAVRHADDHIHLVATLAREDGRRPDDYRSGQRAQAACRRLERELGLTLLNAGDGTAARRPTSAEQHKSRRTKRERTPREELRETVRRALSGAESETEFFDRLAAAGLLVHRKTAPSGDVLGYAVALPGDTNKAGEPVTYSGSKLAPDLSLPRIRARFTGRPPTGSSAGSSTVRPSARRAAAARRTAADAAWSAVRDVEEGEGGTAAAQIAAAGEVLDALAATTASPPSRRELRHAAAVFERAARSRVRAVSGHDRALRRAARQIVYAGPARCDDGTAAMAIDMLFMLVLAAAEWHGRHHHAQQAAAALAAADRLRTAYRHAARPPLSALRQRGQQLPPALQQRYTTVVHDAVPHLASQILTSPGWPALAATLADAENAGHDPAALLGTTAARRELDSAESVADVLVWRLRRAARLTSDTDTTSRTGRPGPSVRGASPKPPHRDGGHQR